MSKTFLFLLMVVLLGYAQAQGKPSNQREVGTSVWNRNTCDAEHLNLESKKMAVKYAKSGIKGDGVVPVYSRGVYMAALGMKSRLRAYLAKKGKGYRNQDILIAAIHGGQAAVVAMLLKMGYNPNQPGSKINVLPLAQAATCSRSDIILYLVQAGANVYGHIRSRGSGLAMTYALLGPGLPMFSKLPKSSIEIVKILLAAGFDARCPVLKNGYTSMRLIRSWLKSKEINHTLRNQYKNLLTVLENSAKIRDLSKKLPPKCGGLKW